MLHDVAGESVYDARPGRDLVSRTIAEQNIERIKNVDQRATEGTGNGGCYVVWLYGLCIQRC